MAVRKSPLVDIVTEESVTQGEIILGEDSNGNIELPEVEDTPVVDNEGENWPEVDTPVVDTVAEDAPVEKVVEPSIEFYIEEGDKPMEKVSATDSRIVGNIVVKVGPTPEEVLEIKQKAYGRWFEEHSVECARLVDDIASPLFLLPMEGLIARIEALKNDPNPCLTPRLIDLYLNELRTHGVDATEYQEYFDSIEYQKPWLRM